MHRVVFLLPIRVESSAFLIASWLSAELYHDSLQSLLQMLRDVQRTLFEVGIFAIVAILDPFLVGYFIAALLAHSLHPELMLSSCAFAWCVLHAHRQFPLVLRNVACT